MAEITILDAPRLLLEDEMERAETYRVGDGTAHAYTRRRFGKNGPNEDAAAIVPVGKDGVVLAVADGVGGMPEGRAASRLAVSALAGVVSRGELAQPSPDPLDQLDQRVLAAFSEAHRAIQALGVGAATTLSVIAVLDGKLRSYHVGDSQAIVTGSGGRRKLVTVPHSPVGFAVKSGRLDERAAMFHHERHLVSNLLGVGDPQVEVSDRIELSRKDTVLLATDGLFDNLWIDEMIERIRKGPTGEAMDRVCADALLRMAAPRDAEPCKPDDIGVILFRRDSGEG